MLRRRGAAGALVHPREGADVTDKLLVRCPRCGTAFAAGIQLDRQSFANAILRNNSYRCPACHTSHAYDKLDHFFEGSR